jgi:hypothetical protein
MILVSTHAEQGYADLIAASPASWSRPRERDWHRAPPGWTVRDRPRALSSVATSSGRRADDAGFSGGPGPATAPDLHRYVVVALLTDRISFTAPLAVGLVHVR